MDSLWPCLILCYISWFWLVFETVTHFVKKSTAGIFLQHAWVYCWFNFGWLVMLCDAFTVGFIILQRINLSHVGVKFDELWIVIMTLFYTVLYCDNVDKFVPLCESWLFWVWDSMICLLINLSTEYLLTSYSKSLTHVLAQFQVSLLLLWKKIVYKDVWVFHGWQQVRNMSWCMLLPGFQNYFKDTD
jgi:hypothetical protein